MPEKNNDNKIDGAEVTEAPTEDSASETTPRIPVKQQLAILAFMLLLIFGTTYLPDKLRSLNKSSTDDQVAASTQSAANEQSSEKIDYFADTEIEAQAAFVWDIQKQRTLYQKNPDEQMPIASITKLMTALVAHELINENEEVVIDSYSIEQDGDSGLLSGESFSFKNLLDLTLLNSSNDGAFAIASVVGSTLFAEGGADTFVEAMNIRAKDLGLTQTYFRNPTGLDISESEGGAYGSARDITFLMEYTLSNYPAILEQTQNNSAVVYNEQGARHDVENTNPVARKIPGLIGSKTGYTELAGGNLAIAFDAGFNRPIIVVVLGSSFNGRFEDILELSEKARLSVNQ